MPEISIDNVIALYEAFLGKQNKYETSRKLEVKDKNFD